MRLIYNQTYCNASIANNMISRHRSDEGLTLETSAFLPFTMANLRFQPNC